MINVRVQKVCVLMIYNASKLIFFAGALLVIIYGRFEYHGDVKHFAEHQAVPLVISGRFLKMLSRDLRMANARFFGKQYSVLKIGTEIIRSKSMRLERKKYVLVNHTRNYIRSCVIFFIFHVYNFQIFLSTHIYLICKSIFEKIDLIRNVIVFINFYTLLYTIFFTNN